MSANRLPLLDRQNLFPGNSELSRLMRQLDWSKTDLGEPEDWPEHWKTAMRFCLTSRIPVVMYWGANFTVLYNDPYISFLGETKHPYYLGRPGQECWSEIWETIGPMLQSVYATSQATWSEDVLMFFARNLPREEVYVRFTFGPMLAADGRTVDGIFCPCTETTEQVVAARRLETLRELGIQPTEARTVETACRESAEVLGANPYDVPFAAIYLVDDPEEHADLVAAAGLSGNDRLPRFVSLNGVERSPWPLGSVFRTQEPSEADLTTAIELIHAGPWPDPITRALILPITGTVYGTLAGLLVVGVSPRRVLDAAYRTFFDLVASHIGTAIADAKAYAEAQKRAEVLAELDRAKSAFFSNVSHEFRTPLTLMLGPIEDILANPDGASAAHRDLLSIVHRNGLRLLRLVNTLLDFSRIEAGRIQAVYEPLDLPALTADLASVFRSAIERAGLKMSIDCLPLPQPVYVDRDMWEKIVLNILSNAFKFTFDGQISVTIRQSGEKAELLVSDTGTGIAADDLPHIFERFHRVPGAHGRTHEGTGIGLALVQELVKLHGGSVSVHSEVGRGTTFTITIPFGSAHLPPDSIGATRSAAPSAITASAFVEEALRWLPDDIAPGVAAIADAPVTTEGDLVLLADDNADMRDYIRRLLSQHWRVETVSDGRAALEAARARRPDLVLTDIMMPHLDGFGLLYALRAHAETQNIPVILVSARAGEESVVEGMQAGADDYLVKPFSARELIARVNAHLQLARMRGQIMQREQEARLQAEQTNRAKDEFLAVLSHELRTPLNAIIGWASILKSGGDVSLLPRALDVIERNARVQSQLIEDLLDVSRIISGKLRLDFRSVDLMAVVTAAIDSVRPAAMAKQIRLQPLLDPKAGPISGDPDRLQQVVWNLLSNAVKFTPNEGRVQIRLERVDSRVEIAVIDTGSGISEQVLPYVFDRFLQADSTSSRRDGGLGLGLALVKHLVELHGGTVRAQSDGTGLGSTFIVTLPLISRLAVADSSRGHPVVRRSDGPVQFSGLEGLRLLIVDIEHETVDLFTHMFNEAGAKVLCAKTAAEAVDIVLTYHPHVIVCDIEMPGEDGYSLIRNLRSLHPKDGGTIPAIAVTTDDSADDRIRLLAAGFQTHVSKPLDPAEFVTIIATLAGRWRQNPD